MPIPRGGSSFPIKASLSSAPHTDLTVILNIDDAVTGVTLSVETLEFSAGVYELSFTINVETVVEVNNCTILFLISGTNADAYYLPMSSQIFKIFNDDVEIAILAGSVVETTRATATVMFSTNKVCTIYYAYALRGTEKPKLEDVVEQNPGLTTTRTEYGNTRIFDSLNQNVIIAGLMGQTSYSLYVFAVDLLGNSTAEPMVSNFRTKDRYPAAEISFTFDQSYVNDVEIEAAGNKVALYLSLHPWRVLSLQNFEPILESNSQRTITFYIMDKPDSDLYPRPIEMISKLSASKSKLVSSLNNFSPSQRITGSELDIESCSWSTYPYILDSSDWKSISFSAGLAEDGKILSILELSDETSRFPFAFQIYEGTNAKNEPALSIKSKTSGGITVNSTYSSISQNTRYNLHIICVNDYPIFPEVLDNSKMVTIQWTTPKKPAPTPLNINSAVCLILSASYLILF